MNMRLWPLVSLLTTLVSVALSVAPGDGDSNCPVLEPNVLLDSRRYNSLGNTWTVVTNSTQVSILVPKHSRREEQ